MKAPFSYWLFAFGLFSAFMPRLNAQHYEPYEITSIAGTNESGSVDGIGNEARFNFPISLAVDPSERLFITDAYANAIRRVVHEGTNWVVTTVTGTNSDAQFNLPVGLAVDGEGALYVTDCGWNLIRKVTPMGTNWVVTTLAGLVGSNPGSADGTNSEARFSGPNGIVVDRVGNLYVADTGNHTIRKLTSMGANWVTTTIAGLAGLPGHADGTNGDARFYYPGCIAVDGNANLYVTDCYNSTIRKIVPSGTNWVVTTIGGHARTGTNGLPVGGYADGVGNQALFNSPSCLAFDHAGNLLVADEFNDAIRKMTPKGTNWMVTTLAGGPESYGTNEPINYPGPGFADGVGARAIFWGPAGIGVGTNGKIFIVDMGNRRIRLGQVVPTLSYLGSAGQLVLSWPAEAMGYVLETSSTPTAAGPWTRLTNGIVVSGNNYFLTNDTCADAAFFRLHKSE